MIGQWEDLCDDDGFNMPEPTQYMCVSLKLFIYAKKKYISNEKINKTAEIYTRFKIYFAALHKYKQVFLF